MQTLPTVLIATALLTASPPSEEDRLFERLRSKADAAAALVLAQRGEVGLRYLILGLRARGRVPALCAWALWQHPHPAAAEHLRPLLLSADQVTGYWAAGALGRIGHGDNVPALAALLPDEQNAFWEQARGGRGILGLKVIKRKRVRFPAPNWMPNIRVTYAAMEALGEIGGDRAEACLMRGLENRQYLVRYGAARGLATMKSGKAHPILNRLSVDDPILIVRMAAAEAVAKMGGARVGWAVPTNPNVLPQSMVGTAHPTAILLPSTTRDLAAAVEPQLPHTLIFVKIKNRTESNLASRDNYPYPRTPWYHWGENLYSLTPPAPNGKLRNLTNLTDGAVQGPELSYDGTHIIFAMRKHFKKEGFHIYEIGVNGTDLRQLTFGNCNDVDPCYLPDGRVVFCSDRAGYREYYHQERSRVLYVVNADGSDIQQITFNPNQDYEPYVLSDGRVLYGSYRFYAQDGSSGALPNERLHQRQETILRTVSPNGTNDQLFYGSMRGSYYTPLRPTIDGNQYSGWHRRGYHVGVAVSQPREMPDDRIICITSAGLTLVDPSHDPTDCEIPLFPEVLNLAGGEEVYIHNHPEMNPVGRYTTPYPLDNDWIIVSHAPWYDLRGNGYGLYLFHLPTRTLKLLYDDPDLSDIDPIPVAPRTPPRVIPSARHAKHKRTGFVYCNSVFNSDVPYDHTRVKFVRVIGALFMGLSINANASFRTRILGTALVETDGSFYVEVPADTPFRFQLLDKDERVVVHETAFNYVRPGERKGCIGCHEPKDAVPTNANPLAMSHPPYRAPRKRGDLIYQGATWNTYSLLVR